LTPQFIPELQIGNDYDEALIEFLLDNEMPYGYSHHWVTFKIAFLSQERVVLASRLPFRVNPYEDPEIYDRYPAYTTLVETAPNPVYVTTHQPWLDELLRQRFAEQSVSFEESMVGPYRIFHHLSQPLSPEDISPLFLTEGWQGQPD
jgi:hypothetical protein